jgi:hypothetical protein
VPQDARIRIRTGADKDGQVLPESALSAPPLTTPGETMTRSVRANPGLPGAGLRRHGLPAARCGTSPSTNWRSLTARPRRSRRRRGSRTRSTSSCGPTRFTCSTAAARLAAWAGLAPGDNESARQAQEGPHPQGRPAPARGHGRSGLVHRPHRHPARGPGSAAWPAASARATRRRPQSPSRTPCRASPGR